MSEAKQKEEGEQAESSIENKEAKCSSLKKEEEQVIFDRCQALLAKIVAVEQAKGKSLFQICVCNIQRIFSNKLVDEKVPGKLKKKLIDQCLETYFRKEQPEDIYQGFLRLISKLHRFASLRMNGNDISIAMQVSLFFMEFIEEKEETERNKIFATVSPDDRCYLEALFVVSKFKDKHLKMISFLFNLQIGQQPLVTDALFILIIDMVECKDWKRAITWIDFFNIKDKFPFEEVVCHLMVDNQGIMLKTFVGEDAERRLQLVNYLDKLVGIKMKQEGKLTELESLLLDNTKRLEKAIPKYLKDYNLSESVAINALDLRRREYLIYNHYMWMRDDISVENYEAVVQEILSESSYVCSYFLEYLCRTRLEKSALYFAVRCNIPASMYPTKLKKFKRENPAEEQKVHQKIQQQNAEQERLASAEEEPCELYGMPVEVVNTWQELKQVMKVIQQEKIVGIDCEWKPSFSAISQQIALIQIAASRAIYLVDVMVLEKKNVSEKQWLSFFEVLFCTERPTKIGFDFRNDLNVLKNTFPFLSKLSAKVQSLVCLYKLLVKVSGNPEASKLVFKSETVTIKMNLCEVARHFLQVDLDKSEKLGYWAQRPLRLEQKKYAAMDAYSLVAIFEKVTGRLICLANMELLTSLQKSALLSFEDKKNSKNITQER